MSRRLTRKQMKKDEFRQAVGNAVDFLRHHSRALIGSLVGILAVLVVILAVTAYLSSASERASEDLARAVQVYAAPLDPTNPQPENLENPSFADEPARRERARELFEAVRKSHGFSDAADVAQVYLADIALQGGDLEEAGALWSEFSQKQKGSGLAMAVRLNLISLDREQGRAQEVAEELQDELGSESKSLPEDVLLFELAVTLESLDRGQEALEYYERILDDYPGSPNAAQARQKSEQLATSESSALPPYSTDPS